MLVLDVRYNLCMYIVNIAIVVPKHVDKNLSEDGHS
jgi:hypothetical protein